MSEKTDTVLNETAEQLDRILAAFGNKKVYELSGNYAYRSGSAEPQTMIEDLDAYQFKKPAKFTVVKAGHLDEVKDMFDAIKNGEDSIQGTITVTGKDNNYNYTSFDDLLQHDYIENDNYEGAKVLAKKLEKARTPITYESMLDVEGYGELGQVRVRGPEFDFPIDQWGVPTKSQIIVKINTANSGYLYEDELFTQEDIDWLASSGEQLLRSFLSSTIDQVSAAYYNPNYSRTEGTDCILSCEKYFVLPTKQFVDAKPENQAFVEVRYLADCSGGISDDDGQILINNYNGTANPPGEQSTRSKAGPFHSVYPTTADLNKVVPLSALEVSSGEHPGFATLDLEARFAVQKDWVDYLAQSQIQTSIVIP